jgi:hypothetical protein
MVLTNPLLLGKRTASLSWTRQEKTLKRIAAAKNSAADVGRLSGLKMIIDLMNNLQIDF